VRLSRIEVAIFALAFALFGLVALALVWSGDWGYAFLANLSGVRGTTFTSYGPGPTDTCCPSPVSLDALLEWHRGWAAYVTGLTANRPGIDSPPITFGRSTFTPDEYAHMADVRGVFRGAEIAAMLALVVAAYRVVRARPQRQALRLIRAGSLVSVAIVAVIGVAAAVAFDPLFLLFHEVFFPQGNFLFAPDSNLLRLYPEWYWQGITAGVAVSFIALALVVAGAAHIAVRRRSNTYTRAA
jgi:hypothetical protein